MKINKNNWHAKFYRASYGELTENFCTYFCKLLLALVLLPITFVGYLIPSVREDSKNGIGTYFLITFLTVMTVLAGSAIGGKIFTETSVFLSIILGTIFLILSFSSFVALVLGVIYFFTEYLPNKSIKPNLISERVKAFKGKYCPRVEWIK